MVLVFVDLIPFSQLNSTFGYKLCGNKVLLKGSKLIKQNIKLTYRNILFTQLFVIKLFSPLMLDILIT